MVVVVVGLSCPLSSGDVFSGERPIKMPTIGRVSKVQVARKPVFQDAFLL